MNISKYLILFSFVFLTSCAMFEHRDYSDQMDEFVMSDEPMFRPNSDFMVISGDSGRDYRNSSEIKRRTPASYSDRLDDIHARSLNRELRSYEARLTEDEYYEFDKIRHKIGSTSEQIYYLRLTEKERHEYLVMRKIIDSPKRNSRGHYGSGPKRVAFYEIPPVKIKDDITLGMDMNQVIGNWGTPAKRDIAGNPTNQNERWAYRRQGKVKYIYFESGRVQGWSEQ